MGVWVWRTLALDVFRFLTWSKTPGGETGKHEFYPDPPKDQLYARGYIAARSAHSRGSTVDLTLVERASGQALDMGTPFDLFGPASRPDAPGMPRDFAAHRALLAQAMMRRGFVGYEGMVAFHPERRALSDDHLRADPLTT